MLLTLRECEWNSVGRKKKALISFRIGAWTVSELLVSAGADTGNAPAEMGRWSKGKPEKCFSPKSDWSANRSCTSTKKVGKQMGTEPPQMQSKLLTCHPGNIFWLYSYLKGSEVLPARLNTLYRERIRERNLRHLSFLIKLRLPTQRK